MAFSLCLPLLVWGLGFSVMWKKTSFISFSIAGFLVLVSLGVWQAYRLQWKTQLLETIKHAALEEPLTLQEALSDTHQDHLFRPIQLKGVLGQEVFYVIGRTHEGQQGYHAIVPLTPENGPTVLLNMGWVPRKTFSMKRGVVTIKGFIRNDEKRWFTPAHVIEKNEWGFVDMEIMGTFLRKKLAPFYVAATFYDGILSDEIVFLSYQSVPNKHLSYAVTWFLLAISWGILMAYFYRKNWLRG